MGAGTLFLVGTPIGNLGDLSERARRTLAAADLVAAEDTRRTGRLLKGIGVSARLVSFFGGNESDRVPELVAALRGGADVAVVSDAGMPGLSDPGFRLVAACVREGIAVDVVPGPSAAVAALVVSGLPTDRFVFEGFLPRRGRARTERLSSLAAEPRTIVLFESPRRVAATLRDLRAALGERRAVIARELTKLHQEIIRGSIQDLAGALSTRELKGEVVLVIEGATSPTAGFDHAVEAAAHLVKEGLRKREAARRAAQLTGVSSTALYAALVARDRPSGG